MGFCSDSPNQVSTQDTLGSSFRNSGYDQIRDQSCSNNTNCSDYRHGTNYVERYTIYRNQYHSNEKHEYGKNTIVCENGLNSNSTNSVVCENTINQHLFHTNTLKNNGYTNLLFDPNTATYAAKNFYSVENAKKRVK